VNRKIEKNRKFAENKERRSVSKRFVYSAVLSSLFMFGISYAWHGIFLNDLSNLNFPIGIYLISTSFVYLITGCLLSKMFSTHIIANYFRNFFIRGICCGAALGLILYMFALVLGITFTRVITMDGILVDVPWQMFEQSLGGLVVAVVYALIYEPIPMNRSEQII
jgi:hypothetical protein